MDDIKERYQCDFSRPLGTPYEDAQVKNHSFKAKRRSDGTDVHLVIFQSSKSGQIHSFHKKIAKIAQVKHPNIVPIVQCLKDPDTNQLFIVLEWNEGYCLKECLKEEVLNEKIALKMIRDVLKGLEELQKHNISHSFINVENLEWYDGRGRLTFRNLIYKTYYLAPQFKEKRQKSFEADLFSLGVCLYRLLFGTLPFKQKTHEQYVKNVKKGISRKSPIPGSHFPRLISQKLQDILNTMCHYQPSERLASLAKVQVEQSEIHFEMEGLIKIVQESDYKILDIQDSNEEYLRGVAVNFKAKQLYHFDVLKYNLTELSGFIDEVIVPFQKGTNNNFANIQEFSPLRKDSIVIFYTYTAQGSLKEYRKLTNFSQDMAGEVNNFLINALTSFKGPYRFLDNQQVVLVKGKLKLKYPPFPNLKLKKRISQAKQGGDFYAPELDSGVQSQTADSWSVGAIDFWMRCDCMPVFDKAGQLLIDNRQTLSPQQIANLSSLLIPKSKERKNLFPLQKKLQLNRKRIDSYDDLSSEMASSPRMKIKHSLQKNKGKTLEVKDLTGSEYPEDKDMEVFDFQQDIERYNSDVVPRIPVKRIRRETTGPKQEKGGNNKLRTTLNSLKERMRGQQNSEEQGEDQRNGNNRENLQESHNNLGHFGQEIDLGSKVLMKSRNRFPSAATKEVKYDRDKRRVTKTSVQTKNSKKMKEEEKEELPVESPQNSEKVLDNLRKEGWKLGQIQKHWSKPFRVVLKCCIALLIYILVFYLDFFSISGSLLKDRYSYTTQQLFLKNNQLSTTATISFTLVTKDPSTAYSQLNNKTLLYVRDTVTCTTNTYWVDSNILSIIQSSAFGAYQAIGIILAIFNLVMLCVVMAKLDFPKALQSCQFDDNIYVPLYSWVIANLALASLTSMTYLLYGGLFHLQLEPCISWTTFPSLKYIFRSQSSSFIWRFVWIYLGLLMAYIINFYVIIRPKSKLHKYVYGLLTILYICSLGARALGSYDGSKQAVMGACGELLALLVGSILLVVDFFISCKLRKIPKDGIKSIMNEQLNLTETKLSPKR